MRENLLPILASPCCKSALTLMSRETCTYEDGSTPEVIQGILTCNRCAARYPVLDGIPRLCTSLEADEEEGLRRIAAIEDPLIHREPARNHAVDYTLIRELVLEKMKRPDTENPYVLKRWETDVEFRLRHCEKQEKFINTLRLHYGESPERILDIGAGQGGLMKCLRDNYGGATVIGLDFDLSWAHVAKRRVPDGEIVRGDATEIPFRNESIDCVVSTSLLEHVPDHDRALEEMCRICGETLFVCWGPNKFSGYDFGHLDAPVTVFPKSIGKRIAVLWHRIRRTGRPSEKIFSELEHTYYISTRHVKRLLAQNGVVRNAFVDFALFSLDSEYAYRMGGLKRFLSAHRRLSRVLFGIMKLLGVEPQCYYVMRKYRGVPDSTRAR